MSVYIYTALALVVTGAIFSVINAGWHITELRIFVKSLFRALPLTIRRDGKIVRISEDKPSGMTRYPRRKAVQNQWALPKSRIYPFGGNFHFSRKFFACFKWFFRGATRDAIELASAEIQRDIRGMRKEKRSRWFINLVVFKHTVGTIVPILYDSGVRVLAKLGPIARWRLPK